MKKKYLPAINIQWPISQEILSEKKTIETRTYPIPEKYLSQDLLLIETPGKNGNFKARIVGIIRFTKCWKYESEKSFYKDAHLHLVTKDSIWAWKKSKQKWGWKISNLEVFRVAKLAPQKKGIIFTSNVEFRINE